MIVKYNQTKAPIQSTLEQGNRLPLPRKILILSLTRRSSPNSATQPKALLWKHLARVYLHILVRSLRLMSYRVTTVTEALAAPVGRFACLTFDVADEHLLTEVLPGLDRLRAPATLFVPTMPTSDQMNWGAIRALAMKGWDIGSLGHELTNLTDHSYVDQRRSVMQSKALLTDHLGAPPKLFAYPFGAYDATTVSCVRDAGFIGAVTLKRGRNDEELGDQASFHLRRLPLRGSLLRDLPYIIKTAFSPSLQPLRNTPGHDSVPSPGVGL